VEWSSRLSATQHISTILNLEWSLRFTEIIHWNWNTATWLHCTQLKTDLGKYWTWHSINCIFSNLELSDHSDHDASNYLIHPGQGFISLLDAPWFDWSWLVNPDPDHPKGMHPYSLHKLLLSFQTFSIKFLRIWSGSLWGIKQTVNFPSIRMLMLNGYSGQCTYLQLKEQTFSNKHCRLKDHNWRLQTSWILQEWPRSCSTVCWETNSG